MADKAWRKAYKKKFGKPYKWKGMTKEYQRAAQARYRSRYRAEAYAAYGGPICACCGEQEEKFLTIDHIHGRGRAHRREIKKTGSSPHDILWWLRHRGYPSGFQVLCFNCNCGRARNKGVCPHAVR